MRVDQFDFDLPPEHIALRPSVPREAAKLLVIRADGTLEHRRVGDLPELLRIGDALVVNDTKVIPARLSGVRLARGESGPEAKMEVTLHKRVAANGFQAFVKPAKRLKPGDILRLGESLEASVLSREGGEIELRFLLSGAQLDAAIVKQGVMPLPPYIAAKRKPDAQDVADYQTVYARDSGSVAAPTAGLHFTRDLLRRLSGRGVAREQVTLHVGAGTFLPMTVDDTEDHRMHSEWARLTGDTATALNRAHKRGGRIVAAGTTALRTLESAAGNDGMIAPFEGETAIFITPGYRFKAVDILLTNFHLPRSTLFMLVCAFAGTRTMKAAYAEAIASSYRFYSYGDACLIFGKST